MEGGSVRPGEQLMNPYSEGKRAYTNGRFQRLVGIAFQASIAGAPSGRLAARHMARRPFGRSAG